MHYNWSDLTPSNFEKLCYFLLERNDFTNLAWHGATGGDKGRDIVAEKIVRPLPGLSKHEKWLIQCKRYVEKRISKTHINQLIADAHEHHPDCVLIITTDTLNSNLKDWVKAVGQKQPFSLHIWEELDLRRAVWEHRTHLSDVIPELSRQSKPVEFYSLGSCYHTFICNEFDEVEIRTCNKRNWAEATAQIEEFLRFVRENDFSVLHDEEPEADD